jgi:hypothetical protein
MNNLIKETDDSIGYLATQLKERNLESHVHIVVVSTLKVYLYIY